MLASYSYARARSKSISGMMFLVASIAIMLLQTSTTVCGVYAQEENGSVPPAGGDIIDAVNGNDQEVTLAMTMMAPGPEMDDTTLRSFFGGPGYGGYGPPRRPPYYYGGGYGGYGPYMPYYGGYPPYYGGGWGYPAQPAPYYPPVGGGGGGSGAGTGTATAQTQSGGRRTEISGVGFNPFPWAPPPDPCVNLRGFYKYNCISENTGSTATASGGGAGAGGGGGGGWQGPGGYPGRRRH